MEKQHSQVDLDDIETREWQESLQAVINHSGKERAQYLLGILERQAQEEGVAASTLRYSAYRNTISLDEQTAHPGDVELEQRLTAIMRWNALCMVARANQSYPELGGHIATFASAAEIFETGFNHFFRGPEAPGGGDLVYLQPHSSPGIYARAYLEGRFDEAQLLAFRQEVDGGGLCSYPHPWLMPDFWQFPTGSMGIGVINAIYQARFLRYLNARGLRDTSQQRVWGVFGDGEMDEPESLAALSLAARERLGNLTFIVNCNLQRLDGPVRGNGQIIQELESVFSGAGWKVIKVLWGSDWDSLFAADHSHALLRHFAEMVDGEYQTLGANDGAYNKKHFFALNPELQNLVAHLSDAQVDGLHRGGHDLRKLYAAFAEATQDPDQPTVILAKTKKGFGMGQAGESRMTAHQQKKLNAQALLDFRDRFDLPLSDEQVTNLEFWRPDKDSPESQYLLQRRQALGGFLPSRRSRTTSVAVPVLAEQGSFLLEADQHPMSTTMVLVRLLSKWLKDPDLGPRIVPIVADEARTFGMANLFRQIGIYSPDGQCYSPEDADSLLSYRESQTGQLLEEGISEAGAISSWVAAATAYSTHDVALLPFYIFYSIFGFQRVGDLIWAAADQRSRGFLIGATAGRTTLSGEGLQHQDGASQLIASTVPNCRSYDPAFGYELATIVDHGARRMVDQQCDEFYYLTVYNEVYEQPSLPADVDSNDIIAGLYRYARHGDATNANADAAIRLLGSGPILREAQTAAEWLHQHSGLTIDVFSVTSYTELAREATQIEQQNRQISSDPTADRDDQTAKPVSHLVQHLAGAAPVVAVSDYVRAYVLQIAPFIAGRFIALGTDGFGRSDTRAKLRRFFQIDHIEIVSASLQALQETGTLPSDQAAELHAKLNAESCKS